MVIYLSQRFSSMLCLLHLFISFKYDFRADAKRMINVTRVVNLGTTTKLCKRNFVPKPHPGHVVVVSRRKIG